MTDTKKLDVKIKESGLKRQFIADKMNLCYVSLLNRLNGNKEFKQSEIVNISEILKLSKKDVEDIFLR